MKSTLVLASQSPRRRALINLLGCPVTAVTAEVDEMAVTTADPAQNAIDTARLKADAILAQWGEQGPPVQPAVLVAADTNVAWGQTLLGKPENGKTAAQMLRQLRQQQHMVHSGMVVIDMTNGRTLHDVSSATVTMRDYSDAEIAAYVATGDPFDKAGAYAIQHPVFQPVESLSGCYLAVMGLSICHLAQLLHQLNVPLAIDVAQLHLAHKGFPCPYALPAGN